MLYYKFTPSHSHPLTRTHLHTSVRVTSSCISPFPLPAIMTYLISTTSNPSSKSPNPKHKLLLLHFRTISTNSQLIPPDPETPNPQIKFPRSTYSTRTLISNMFPHPITSIPSYRHAKIERTQNTLEAGWSKKHHSLLVTTSGCGSGTLIERRRRDGSRSVMCKTVETTNACSSAVQSM